MFKHCIINAFGVDPNEAFPKDTWTDGLSWFFFARNSGILVEKLAEEIKSNPQDVYLFFTSISTRTPFNRFVEKYELGKFVKKINNKGITNPVHIDRGPALDIYIISTGEH